jgi:calcium permeable stress-gated cation channel
MTQTFNLRDYLKGAYVHPVFQKNDIYELVAINEEEKNPLVVTKRQFRMITPMGSKFNSNSSTNEGEFSRLTT